MPLIILVPSAIILYYFSSIGYWKSWVVVLQMLEIMADVTSVVLMGLNIRDGIKLRNKT